MVIELFQFNGKDNFLCVCNRVGFRVCPPGVTSWCWQLATWQAYYSGVISISGAVSYGFRE
jgi:hypothetical protein